MKRHLRLIKGGKDLNSSSGNHNYTTVSSKPCDVNDELKMVSKIIDVIKDNAELSNLLMDKKEMQIVDDLCKIVGIDRFNELFKNREGGIYRPTIFLSSDLYNGFRDAKRGEKNDNYKLLTGAEFAIVALRRNSLEDFKRLYEYYNKATFEFIDEENNEVEIKSCRGLEYLGLFVNALNLNSDGLIYNVGYTLGRLRFTQNK